ncbi:MAG: tetratricopeptide repeat protein, partial [Planctomycetota bacterium]
MPDNSTQQENGFDLNQALVPLVFGCLVFIPVLYYGLDSELARWKSARAQLLYEEGQFEDSIELMRTAVKQSPRNLDLQLQLAEKLMRHGEAKEALGIIEDVRSLSENPLPALRAKASCLLYLGRPKDSLDTVKGLSDHIMPEDFGEPARLNELAYARGLAKVELDEAFDDIQTAIETIQRRQWWEINYPMPLEDQALVALSLIARTVDSGAQVLPILEQRIQHYHDLYQKTKNQISSNVYELFDHDFPLDYHQEEIIHHSQIQLYSLKRDYSLLLGVRALIYQ